MSTNLPEPSESEQKWLGISIDDFVKAKLPYLSSTYVYLVLPMNSFDAYLRSRVAGTMLARIRLAWTLKNPIHQLERVSSPLPTLHMEAPSTVTLVPEAMGGHVPRH